MIESTRASGMERNTAGRVDAPRSRHHGFNLTFGSSKLIILGAIINERFFYPFFFPCCKIKKSKAGLWYGGEILDLLKELIQYVYISR